MPFDVSKKRAWSSRRGSGVCAFLSKKNAPPVSSNLVTLGIYPVAKIPGMISVGAVINRKRFPRCFLPPQSRNGMLTFLIWPFLCFKNFR